MWREGGGKYGGTQSSRQIVGGVLGRKLPGNAAQLLPGEYRRMGGQRVQPHTGDFIPYRVQVGELEEVRRQRLLQTHSRGQDTARTGSHRFDPVR